MTGLLSVPMQLILTSTTSLGCRYRGGSKPISTPLGVPVAMTSPGWSVMALDSVAMRVGMSKINAEIGDLAKLPVHRGVEPARRHVGDLVPSHQRGTHGTERVDPLVDDELDVALLQVPGGDVIDHGVAVDVLPRAFGFDLTVAGPMTTPSSPS